MCGHILTFERLKQDHFRWDANKFDTETLSQKKLMKSTIHLHPLIRITVYPSAACPRSTQAHPLVWPRDMGIRSAHCIAARGRAADVKVETTLLLLYWRKAPSPFLLTFAAPLLIMEATVDIDSCGRIGNPAAPPYRGLCLWLWDIPPSPRSSSQAGLLGLRCSRYNTGWP